MRKSQLPRGPGAVDGPSWDGAVLLAVSWPSTAAACMALSWLLQGEGLGEALRTPLHRSGLEIVAGFPTESTQTVGAPGEGLVCFHLSSQTHSLRQGVMRKDNNEGQ